MASGWGMHREQQRGGQDTGLHSSPLLRILPTPGQGQLAHPTGENGNLGGSHLPTGGWPGSIDFQLGQDAHSPGHSLDPVPMPPGLVPSRATHALSPSVFRLALSRVGSASTWPRPAWSSRLGLMGGGEKPRRGSPQCGWGRPWACGGGGGAEGQAGRWHLSCCGRSGGAGQSPGGTAGKYAAAGSTAGSSRRGHR